MSKTQALKHRRSREEILESYKACATQLGRTPGMGALEKMTGIKKSEVNYYWPKPEALAEATGLNPNEWPDEKLDLNELFSEYARLCRHIRKIPTRGEFRIAQRELGTRTHTVYERFGSIEKFLAQFREWLNESEPDVKAILEFEGWRTPAKNANPNDKIHPTGDTLHHPGLRPFLPSCLQYLNALARGERPPFESPDSDVDLLFERRTSDAFRCLGFDVKQLGQGTGRKADSLAVAGREHFALILDAKVRTNGYILGTEDRKFLEYAKTHGKELQRQGIRSIYFVVVGPSFKPTDLEKLTGALANEPSIRNVDLLTATALMRMVEDSIRNRSAFSLTDLEKEFFGNKLISE